MNWAYRGHNPCGHWEVGHDLIWLVRDHETTKFLSQLGNPKDMAKPAWGASETSSLWWERERDLHGGDLHADAASVGC